MADYCFGIDVGGTSIKCGLFNTAGEVLDKWEIKTRIENDGSEILPDVSLSIQNKLQEKQIKQQEVVGVGIGVPGPVNSSGELPYAVNLNWGYRNIEQELGDLCGFPVKAGNDANVAALGEMWKGGGEGSHNIILITLGTGLGGGIIVDGKMVVGAHGAGGEIGHAVVNPKEEEACNCGNKGCLEQYTSATGIVRLAKRALASLDTPSSLRDEQEISAKKVFDAYRENDKMAIQVVEQFADYLGEALAIFSCVADPEVIVVGGGVSKAGKILIEAVEKAYRKCAFQACKDTPIVLAQLGNDAGIYGAARLILSDII